MTRAAQLDDLIREVESIRALYPLRELVVDIVMHAYTIGALEHAGKVVTVSAENWPEEASFEELNKEVDSWTVFGATIQDLLKRMLARAHELGAQEDYRE